MRTTIDIDTHVLEDVRRVQKREGTSLGRLVSDLLAQALAASQQEASASTVPAFRWLAKPMNAKVDLGDKDAVLDAMAERRTRPEAISPRA